MGSGPDAPPRPEYPRPQFRRPGWINLNGEWSFAFYDKNAGLGEGWHRVSAEDLRAGVSPFDRRITVPFCYQSSLSGIGDASFHDVVWYARSFESSPSNVDERLLLHFGAVDYRATVWINGARVAEHEGGHTPFSADVTRAFGDDGENVVVVRAEDPSRDVTIPGASSTGGRNRREFSTRAPRGSGRPSGWSPWATSASIPYA
jgi:beta-galactosidase/beta-glucuronidase